MSDFNLDEIIATLQEGKTLPEKQLITLLMKFMEVLYTESNVLELQSPITICGDIHGQLYDLFELFKAARNGESFGNQQFLFMGDYVDRGRFSLETFAYLVALKLRYPGKFYLLRGNHECRQVNQMYGFYNETQFYYGHAGVWSFCNEVFDILPMAAVIDGKVFSVHGGLSPDIALIEKISTFDRQAELPASGALCDLCWSDPDDTTNNWRENQRGAGYLFGAPQTKAFCHNNNLSLVTRSHQLAMEGFQKFFDDMLITVWSAPNYMYRSNNKATVMKYYSDKPYELVEFKPCPDNERKIPEDIPTSGYFL